MTFSLLPETSKSLVKKYLTEDMYKDLQNASTNSGFTIDKAIQSGIANPDSSIGIYAGDAESYQNFSTIFEPIICDYHGVSREKKHISSFHGVDLPDPDPEKKFILSTRIRVARNIKEVNFTSHITLAQRKILEKKIVDALHKLKGNLKGNYLSYELMDKVTSLTGNEQKLHFEKGDRFQQAAGINSDFPRCRGLFSSFDKRLRVWVNEEDHMRIISQDQSSDLSGVFNHLCKALAALEKVLGFEKNEKYGYLTSCPTNIGTAMRAGVHIHLEKLNKNRSILTSLTKAHGLQIRGTSGEKTQVVDGVFDVSNRRRLGVTETDIVTNLHQGLLAIIEAEKAL